MFEKNILLIETSVSATKVEPHGLLYVGGALKKSGYNVQIFHLWPEEIREYERKIYQYIIERRPIIVGFSVLSVETQYAAYLSKVIKKINSKIPIVWGGIHPTLLPKQCLQEEYIDYVVIGEGEYTIVELVTTLDNGNFAKSLSAILGIGYKKNGILIINEMRPFIKNMDEFPPDYSLIDVTKYLSRADGMRTLSFVTSRGCPYACGFCYNQAVNTYAGKRKIRAHSVDLITGIINDIKTKYSVQRIYFYDDYFLFDKARALDILEKIDTLSWIELRINDIKKDLLKNLWELKAHILCFGWESGNDRILKLINKRFLVKDILTAAEVLQDFHKFTIYGSGIIGFPTETSEEIANTFRLAAELVRRIPNFQTNVGFYLPYPGTPLAKLALENGWQMPERTEDWGKTTLGRYDIDKMQINWLPWLNKKKKMEIKRASAYIANCYKPSRFKFRKIPSYLRYFISYLRLRYNFYCFPIEIYLSVFLLGRYGFHFKRQQWSLEKKLKNFLYKMLTKFKIIK